MFIFKDSYNYLHATLFLPSLFNFIYHPSTNCKGGFLTINLENEEYLIIDKNNEIILLKDNNYIKPSTSTQKKIEILYLSYNIKKLKYLLPQ